MRKVQVLHPFTAPLFERLCPNVCRPENQLLVISQRALEPHVYLFQPASQVIIFSIFLQM